MKISVECGTRGHFSIPIPMITCGLSGRIHNEVTYHFNKSCWLDSDLNSFICLYLSATYLYDGNVKYSSLLPGAWFFHCHLAYHGELGMALVLNVGEPEQLPPVPAGFPKCGNFKNIGPPPPPASRGDIYCASNKLLLILLVATCIMAK